MEKEMLTAVCSKWFAKTFHAVMASMICLKILSGGSALGQPPQTPAQPQWSYDSEMLWPFWLGTTMRGESVLFIRDETSGEAKASVLFPIQRLHFLKNSEDTITWEEGRDYVWKPGSREIILPVGSRIPSRTVQELRRPANTQKYQLTHRDGNGEIFFGSSLEYHEMQTCVTYDHEPNLWTEPTPVHDRSRLPKTIDRLLNKRPLSVVVLGDSISAGCNASGWAGGAPFQPAWPELLQHHLSARFQGKVTVANPSVGGTDTAWVLNMVDKVAEPDPQLVILAFGMNDAAGRTATEYRDNMVAVMQKIRERLPDVEFILIASMTGNRDWTRLNPDLFPQYRDVLSGLCSPGVAMADLTSVWTGFLRVKKDWDQTGNGVNHPNDFGHRVYTQVVSSLLIPPGQPVTGREAPVDIQSGPLKLEEQLLLSDYTYSYACVAADLDGDGDPDLTTADAEPNNNIYLLKNDGRGRFEQSYIQRYEMLRDQPTRVERHAIGDVNQDGHPDVVIVDNLNWDIRWFENPGGDRLTQPWQRHRISKPKEVPGSYDVALADLDGDGDLDVAASSWRFGNRFDWFENPGKSVINSGDESSPSGLTWVRHEVDGMLSETRTIAVADFNSDGKPDLLGTARTGNQILWYENSGRPASEKWRKHVIDDQTVSPAHGHPVDMDGDGDPDVVMAFGIASGAPNDATESHQVAWYENPGGHADESRWKKHEICGSFPQGFEAVAGDLDNDGDQDVVATAWGPATGQLAWFENMGDPTEQWNQHTIRTNWPNAVTVILTDLDQDGRPDIVACAERGANELRWWRNAGSDR